MFKLMQLIKISCRKGKKFAKLIGIKILAKTSYFGVKLGFKVYGFGRVFNHKETKSTKRVCGVGKL